MLDFGTGSGILAVAAAKLGATVQAVEIDESAIENAKDNAGINHASDRIHFARTLQDASGPFELIVANILRSVLLEFAHDLVDRLAHRGTLVLSGLVSTDVPEVSTCYASLLGQARPEIYRLGDWCALVWRSIASGTGR